jgi:protoporphyrinogen oxidase
MMNSLLLLFVICVIVRAEPFRVGVIGGGMAGASIPYFIKKYKREGVDVIVDVFEKRGELGGRVRNKVFTYNGGE